MTADDIRKEFGILYSSGVLNSHPIKTKTGTILDPVHMVGTHMAILKGKGSERVKDPYKSRLIKLLEYYKKK